MPEATGIQGYPTQGESASYSGLCSFACNYGNCIEGVCGTVEVPLTVPTASPFTLDTCTAGSGSGAFAGLCSYACNWGYCPMHNCTCTATGPLNLPPAANVTIKAVSTVGGDTGLCEFACQRGYCPSPTCVDNTKGRGSCNSNDGSNPKCAESSLCDFTKTFSTLDDLAAALDALDPLCVGFYTLEGLQAILYEALTNYSSITSDYDSKFNDYVKYVREMIPLQLQAFMRTDEPYGLGNQFFRCTFFENGSNRTTGSCPGDIGILSGTYTVYYELTNSTGFYNTLLSDYGLDSSWVIFGSSKNDFRDGQDRMSSSAQHVRGLPT